MHPIQDRRCISLEIVWRTMVKDGDVMAVDLNYFSCHVKNEKRS